MKLATEHYIRSLKEIGFFPNRIEIAQWRSWNLVSCFDSAPSELISESVSMGIDCEPETALKKCMTEFCERSIAKLSDDPVAKLTQRSDGFAAFPVLNGNIDFAKTSARENAINEATERYLWSKWWDNENSHYKIGETDDCILAKEIKELISAFDLKRINEIQVDDASQTFRLSILLAETRDGGFVTGGACSKIVDPLKRLVPAFGELLRHLIIVRKMKTTNYSPLTFYEKRLYGFGIGPWHSLVSHRLGVVGGRRIPLPELVADKEIEHPAMNLICVHRCLYQEQPVFIGGELERLCI